MKFTAQQIADILGGEVVGNPKEQVTKLSKIEEGEKGSLTFLSIQSTIHSYTLQALLLL